MTEAAAKLRAALQLPDDVRDLKAWRESAAAALDELATDQVKIEGRMARLELMLGVALDDEREVDG